MTPAKKTIQSHIDFYIENQCEWVDVEYRGSDWKLTSEQYPEEDTDNFYFNNGKKVYVIFTKHVFHNPNPDNEYSYPILQSAKVMDIEEEA